MSTEEMFEGDIQLPDIDEAEMQAILDEGDPVKIQALMEGKKPVAEVVEDDEEVIVEDEPEVIETPEVKKAEPEKKEDVDSAASGAEGEAVSTQDKPVFLTKDGKHTIPYDYVEGLRESERTAREQLTAALAEVENLKGRGTKLQGALEKNGIDISAIEQGDVLTDEQIEALKELDPAVADVVRILNARSQAMAEQLQSIQSRPVIDPTELAIRAIPDLVAWRQADSDEWRMAQFIDDKLEKDPAFKDLPLDARFAEAVKRTKAAFGEAPQTNKEKSVDELAAEKIAAAKARPQVPQSLTDVGSTPQTERSQQDVFLDISNPEEMAARMGSMSKAQLKQLLAGVEIVG